ncbi:type I restriction enzyme HsdR N-terminal domain-containing protein [Thermodesulfatator indicus]
MMITCNCAETTCEIQDDAFKAERKAIRNFLVEKKGYLPEEIKELVPLVIEVGQKRLYTMIDLLVNVAEKPAIVIRINEGSVVSRERGTIAAARLISPDAQPPFCVQTNGEDFSIIDTITKKCISESLEGLPSRQEMLIFLNSFKPKPLTPKQIDGEKKILFFYDGVG